MLGLSLHEQLSRTLSTWINARKSRVEFLETPPGVIPHSEVQRKFKAEGKRQKPKFDNFKGFIATFIDLFSLEGIENTSAQPTPTPEENAVDIDHRAIIRAKKRINIKTKTKNPKCLKSALILTPSFASISAPR